MPFFLYASFPNSRNRNRPPTVAAVTYQVPLVDYTQPLTLVAEANQNRTYILIKNLSLEYSLWYIYAQQIAFDPSVVPTFGVVEQLRYNQGTNTLYQKQSTGIGIDWTIVNIADVGERVEALQTASLDSLESIWCAADTNVPVLPVVEAGIDEGRG